MTTRKIVSMSSAALMFAILLSCSGQSNGSNSIDRPNPKLKTVTLSIGAVAVRAEVAATEIERNRGLMFRKTLKDGDGMLFVFDYDQKVSFWMKNTILPLSIAYISSDGTITQILDLTPQSEEPRSSERSIRFALEVPRGWFSRAGVKEGDVVSIPPLK